MSKNVIETVTFKLNEGESWEDIVVAALGQALAVSDGRVFPE